MKKVAYVEHPVSLEQKAEITGKGFRIVDARYKPAELDKGDEVFMKPKKKAEAK